MVILRNECPSFNREGLLYSIKRLNLQRILKISKTKPTIFVDDSYVFGAEKCERIAEWSYR